jgi:hypothetical protein
MVGHFNRRVQVLESHHVQHRAVDFFLRDSHAGLHFIEHRCAEEESDTPRLLNGLEAAWKRIARGVNR